MDATERVRRAVETSDGTTRSALAAELGLPLGTVTTAVAGLLQSGVLAERVQRSAAAERGGREESAGRAGRAGAARTGRPPALLVPTGPPRTVGTVVWTHGRLQAAVTTYGGTVLARGDLDADDGAAGPAVLEPAWRFLEQAGCGPLDRVVLGVPAPFQRGVGLPPARPPVPGGPEPDPVSRLGQSPEDRGDESRDTDGRDTASRAAGVGRPRPAGEGPRAGFAPWLRPDPAAALAERLGAPVVIENDANLGALGEARAGAGRGHRSQIYLKVGERSVGGGLVLDGALYRGISGFAGEVAHIHADDDGPVCACGARGCLSARARQVLRELMEHTYDRPLTFAEVLRLADADEPAPARALREVGRTLGRPLADLCTFLDPGVLILDGALGPAGRHVLAGLREQIERYCSPAVAASLTILPGALGADADIHGAVQLARTEALAAA